MATPIDMTNERGSGSSPQALHARIQQQIEQHPYRTLAVATGVGFLLGGGMFGRVAGKLIATGLRVGLAAYAAPLAAELVEQLRGEAEGTTH